MLRIQFSISDFAFKRVIHSLIVGWDLKLFRCCIFFLLVSGPVAVAHPLVLLDFHRLLHEVILGTLVGHVTFRILLLRIHLLLHLLLFMGAIDKLMDACLL